MAAKRSSSPAAVLGARLAEQGYTVRTVRGAQLTDLRAAQRAVATALHLPGNAATNLDALVDTLRDLDDWWPHDPRLALLWEDADVLQEHDPKGWATLQDILDEASEREPGRLRIETVGGAATHRRTRDAT